MKASKKYSINPSLSVSHAEGTPVIFWVNALAGSDTDHYSPLFLESPASVIHSFARLTKLNITEMYVDLNQREYIKK